MKGLKADVVHALRHYLTTPASSAVAVAVLAAAMAVLTAFLALWSDLALTPHAGFERSRELATVSRTDGRRMLGITYGFIERIEEEVSTIASITGSVTLGQFLEQGDDRPQVGTELVTASYFPSLAPPIQLGRPFDAADHQPDAEPVVILSDAFWREHFGGRADALGQTLRVHGPNATLRMNDAVSNAAEKVRDYRIVGVMAATMSGTYFPVGMWMPFESTVEHLFVEIGGLDALRRTGFTMPGIARTAPGASVNALRTELQGRYDDPAELGTPMPGVRIDAIAGVVRDINQQRDALTQLKLFLAGSVLLALVAACNISLFLLSRAPGRQRELAIRMAVGAPLKRLARQLVTEAGVLVVVATGLGLLLALWVTVLVGELAFLSNAQSQNASPFDGPVLAIVAGAALLITALVSLAPVLGLRRVGIAAGSRAVTARAGWAQRLAGTVQLSVAAVISAAALAFVWYLAELARTDAGFSAADVLVVTTFPENPPDMNVDVDVFMQEREHRRRLISALPGVEDVAFGTSVPGQWRPMWMAPVAPPDQPDEGFTMMMQSADPNYLRLLNARLLAGRLPEDGDREEIVINETLARRTWGRVDVIGEILPLGFSGPNAPRWEVAGVTRDIAYLHPSEEQEPVAYHVASQLSAYDWMLVRTRRSVTDFQRELQQLIDDRELEVRIGTIRQVDEVWGQMLAPDRARTGLTVATAVLVVVLAAFGYYGTQRFLVAAGRREYAILGALGAGPRALGRLVLARGLKLGAPGVVLGGLLAFITVAWLRGDFVSDTVSPIAVTGIVLAAIAALLLLAGIGPAREARRTDPGLLKQD